VFNGATVEAAPTLQQILHLAEEIFVSVTELRQEGALFRQFPSQAAWYCSSICRLRSKFMARPGSAVYSIICDGGLLIVAEWVEAYRL
jgi:hypothetical protein